MLRSLSLLAAMSGIAACTTDTSRQRDTFTPEVRAELVAARDTVWRAWFGGDSALLVQVLGDPMVGMGQSRDEIIADGISFRKGGGTLVSLDFTDEEFLVHGGMALILSSYQVVTSTAGAVDTTRGRATEVFTFEDGRWINPYWHLHEN